MKNSFTLAVSGVQGITIGTIAAEMDMMTSVGRITKVNQKSIVVRNQKGEDSNITERQYNPTVLYAMLTDEQVKNINYSTSDIESSEALRQLSKMDIPSLVDVITGVVDTALTKNAYNNHNAKLYSQYGDFDDTAKLAMINKILNAN